MTWIIRDTFLHVNGQEVPGGLQITQKMFSPPKLHSNTLLLNLLHSLTTGHRELNLKQIQKLPYGWIIFIVLEGAMQAAGGEKISRDLPSPGIYVLQLAAARKDGANWWRDSNGIINHWIWGLLNRR